MCIKDIESPKLPDQETVDHSHILLKWTDFPSLVEVAAENLSVKRKKALQGNETLKLGS